MFPMLRCRASVFVLVVLSLGLAARSAAAQAVPAPAPPNPALAEVPLPASGGWNGTLVLDNGAVGIWTCGAIKAFPLFGCPEIFGLDDKGHCIVLSSYSGKWTPNQTVEDGEWLGGFAQVDLDPRWSDPEMYTGGKRGNLYAIRVHHQGGFDTAIIARFPGQEIHTLVGGDLIPGHAGNELIAFTHTGDVYDIRPRDECGVSFDAPRIATLSGRVRDARLLPAAPGEAPRVLAVCRSGEVLMLRFEAESLTHKVVLADPMGFGRVAVRAAVVGEPVVAYVTRDDGVILRLAEQADGSFVREVIYAGPQGPRGIAAGRFDADPLVESVAVFGYSSKVELLSRPAGGKWTVETIFQDRDKGHWLATAELDARNATDEIIGSGYSGRVVLLARPPGYGQADVLATRPTDRAPAMTAAPTVERAAFRLAVLSTAFSARDLTPLSYRGGFESKSLLHETLLRRDASGRLGPGLATSWESSADGRSWTLGLRPGARWHDGRPVDAESVRMHFKRWIGLPENDWLGASRFVRDIEADGPDRLVFHLDRPYALLPDLCAINPAAVQGPGSRDGEGALQRAVGSSDYSLARWAEDGRSMFLSRFSGRGPDSIEVVLYGAAGRRPIDDLLAGRIDAVVNGWTQGVAVDRLDALRADARFRVTETIGSSVRWLVFQGHEGPTTDVDVRRAIARAVDRDAMVRDVERGHATPCETLFGPTLGVWRKPSRTAELTVAHGAVAIDRPLRLIVGTADSEAIAARNVARDLATVGVRVTVAALEPEAYASARDKNDWDLRLASSWGVPYDPFISLRALFMPADGKPNAVAEMPLVNDARLTRLIESASREVDQERRSAIYGAIEDLVQTEGLIVPLWVPHRGAVTTAAAPRLALTHDLYHVDFE